MSLRSELLRMLARGCRRWADGLDRAERQRLEDDRSSDAHRPFTPPPWATTPTAMPIELDTADDKPQAKREAEPRASRAKGEPATTADPSPAPEPDPPNPEAERFAASLYASAAPEPAGQP